MRPGAFVLGVAACFGCQAPSAPSPPSVRTVTAELAGYKIVFESPPKTAQGAEANHSPDGTGRVVDHITITCGEQVDGIDDAELTLNGVALGKVKRGDTIKVTATGEVFVNDEPRKP